MARLHDSRRPLVVSFKRRKPQIHKPTKQVIFDAELQDALDNLKEEPKRRDLLDVKLRHAKSYPYNKAHEIPVYKTSDNLPSDCSYIELHSLQPRHICPVNGSKLPFLLPTYPKVEDIEIFQEQRFKINSGKRRHNNKGSVNSFKTLDSWNLAHSNDNGVLPKSCTMPQMVTEYDKPKNNSFHPASCNGKPSSLNKNWENRRDYLNVENDRSNSCSHIECFIGKSNYVTCQPSESIVIEVT